MYSQWSKINPCERYAHLSQSLKLQTCARRLHIISSMGMFRQKQAFVATRFCGIGRRVSISRTMPGLQTTLPLHTNSCKEVPSVIADINVELLVQSFQSHKRQPATYNSPVVPAVVSSAVTLTCGFCDACHPAAPSLLPMSCTGANKILKYRCYYNFLCLKLKLVK